MAASTTAAGTFLRWAVGCVVVAASSGAWLVHAQAPSSAPPTFHAGVDLVQFDVSVVDKKTRLPVTGLTAADFTVSEDGKPRPVAAFSAVNLPDRDMTAAAWTREVGPDVVTNHFDSQRIVLVLIDDLNVAFNPFDAQTLRHIGHDVVDNLGPSDLAAVVYVVNRSNGQEFTTDHARLRAAVDRFTSNSLFNHGPDGGLCPRRICLTDAFRVAARTLAAFTGRRKSTIFVSENDQTPMDFHDEAMNDPEMTEDLRKTFDDLQRANVNVYTFDPHGLSLFPYAQVTLFSDNTGGWAVGGNEPWREVAQVFRENSSYYILGVEPADTRANGAFHDLDVAVNRPGVEVHARRGFFAPEPPAEAKSQAPARVSTLEAAVSGALPKGDIPLSLTAVPLGLSAKPNGTVAIVAGADAGDVTNGRVDLLADAFNDDWKLAGTDVRHFDVMQSTGGARPRHYDLVSRLNLAPGRYEIRVAITQPATGRTGSAYASVTVPDFSKDALSASGVLLERQPPTADAPQGPLAGLVPLRPTTVREFTKADRVTAFLRLYEGGKQPIGPVSITMRVVNAADHTVSTHTVRVPVESFRTDRSADLLEDVPVSGLDVGDYLLTLDVGDGKNHPHRDVRFTVK